MGKGYTKAYMKFKYSAGNFFHLCIHCIYIYNLPIEILWILHWAKIVGNNTN